MRQGCDMPNLYVLRRLEIEQILHKCLNIGFRYPDRAEPRVDFRGIQVFGDDRLQRLKVFPESRVGLRGGFGHNQFLANVARKVSVLGFPLFTLRIKEHDALQLGQDFPDRLAKQPAHVRKIYSSIFVE